MIEKILLWLLFKWQNRESLKVLGGTRSPRWSKVRKAFLETHPVCALCGGTKTLEVHHKKPFHLNPELELNPDNLIVLCESGKNGIVCHRAFGHLGNYKKINPDVDKDVEIWYNKLKG